MADRLLLENLVPASALIDPRGEILHIHGRTGRFLELAAGTPTPNIFELAREGLRLELPAAVREAVRLQRAVYRHDLHVQTHAGLEPVRLGVKPVVEAGQANGLLLITFEAGTDIVQPAKQATRLASGYVDDATDAHMLAHTAQLEHELQHVRGQLHRALDALAAAEHDQSTAREKPQFPQQTLYNHNDELETSRQELQSMNEELQTLNAELQDRNSELSLLRDDLHNLFHSSGLATLFLDTALNIKRFTAEAAQLFRVRDGDIGRPIDDMASSLRYSSLLEDARQVLGTLVYCEREVQTSEGEWQRMRIVPYRTAQNEIAGLVLTFENIAPLKRAQQRTEQLRALAERILAALPSGVLLLDEQLIVRAANPTFCRLFGVNRQRIVGEPLRELAREWGLPRLNEQIMQLSKGGSFPALHLPGPGIRERERGASELVVTAIDLADPAEVGRYVLLVEDAPANEPTTGVRARPAG
jgi:two-component system CheB/CheR fusion protein